MIEQAVTTTRIMQTGHLSANDMDKLIFYCAGEDARACIIQDNNELASRDEMVDSLRKIREIDILNKVFPNPKVSDIMEMADYLKNKRINVVIGIGGGSSLDSAKGVAAVLSNGGDLDDYLGGDATRKIEKKDVKLILIPTTMGTGSEVTKVGVYTSRSGRKYTLGSPLLQADIAILVTEYVTGLPSSITASTTFDALSHALETLWNRNATPLSDRVATESAVHILKWIETAYDSSVSGENEGMAEMLEGACMAGTAFSMTGTAAVHALSFILSEEWHVPHGVACAFTLEDVFKLNLQDELVKQKLIKVARLVLGWNNDGDQSIDLLLDRLIKLKKKFGLPCSFKDLHIRLEEDRIGELFNKALDDPKMKNNSIPVDEKIVFELIKSKI
jgi:alcohol dehydrogenase class IV